MVMTLKTSRNLAIALPIAVICVGACVLFSLFAWPKLRENTVCKTHAQITIEQINDKRYEDEYRGWYKKKGCPGQRVYCGWGGSGGSGGDPYKNTKFTNEEGKGSTWSCTHFDSNGKEFYTNYENKNFGMTKL